MRQLQYLHNNQPGNGRVSDCNSKQQKPGALHAWTSSGQQQLTSVQPGSTPGGVGDDTLLSPIPSTASGFFVIWRVEAGSQEWWHITAVLALRWLSPAVLQ
jgi:hypothetical protein